MLQFELHPEKHDDAAIEPRFFTLAELTKTSVDLPNYPRSFTEVANLRALADFLDMLRDELGYAIFINSAYRTAEVNGRVNGATNSLHKRGRAADIWTFNNQVENLIDICRKHRNELSEFIVNRDKNYIHIAI